MIVKMQVGDIVSMEQKTRYFISYKGQIRSSHIPYAPSPQEERLIIERLLAIVNLTFDDLDQLDSLPADILRENGIKTTVINPAEYLLNDR